MPKHQHTRVAAYALILQEGEILLCRLSKQVLPQWVGFWTLPGGGIEFGESPEDAVVREVKEETGLEIIPVSLAFIDSNLIKKEEADYHGIRIVFYARIIGGDIRFEQNGTTDLCQWHQLPLSNDNLVDLVQASLPHLGSGS